jgi:hypothetical protein
MKIFMSLMIVAVLAAFAPVAHAITIQIQYQIDAGPITTCSMPNQGPVFCADLTVQNRLEGVGAGIACLGGSPPAFQSPAFT